MTDRLSAHGVGVRFDGLVALDEVELSVRPGEILGLIGPNGAGKTTLVNVLTGFQRPSSGDVVIDGWTATGAPANLHARKGLGRTFQAVRLFPHMSVLENVELGAVGKGVASGAARSEAERVLAWLGLADYAQIEAGTLPYGDERWVGVARALAGRPRYLLLDEPAAGLNDAEATRLLDVIVRIRQEFGTGIILVEHNMQLVMSLCDRIHVLEHGRTIMEGTPEEAQSDPEVRRAYLGTHAEAKRVHHRRQAARGGPDTGAPPLLAVNDLSVTYGPVEALRGVSLTVGEGELVSVVGPNGAGKSTLMLAITGVVPTAGGDIRFGGTALNGRAVERIVCGGISMVPEGRHVFPALTVEENLLAGAAAAGGRAAVAADIGRMLDTFPILRDRLRQPAGKLSGGEQQQLVIARALVARPRLLLLDEPSLGLAPRVITQVFEILADMRDAGQTILMVEQNATRALEISDRTYVLRSGDMVLEGVSAALLDDPAFERAYFGFSEMKAVPA